MGKKAERLEEELDIVIAERNRFRELYEEQLVSNRGAVLERVKRPRAPEPDADDESLTAMERPRVDPDTDVALDDARTAIQELRNPTAPPTKTESLTEIVQANNRERAALQVSTRSAHQLVSRVASALGITTWNAEGDEILARAQQLAQVGIFVKRKHVQVSTELARRGADPLAKAELSGWLRALDFVTGLLGAPVVEPTVTLTAPEGLRYAYGDGTQSVVVPFGAEGDLEIVICRDADVVTRTMISALQLRVAGYSRAPS